jgi:PAS domain S-box-containing protein
MTTAPADDGLFRLMADHSPVMLWKAGTNGDCDFFNERWLQFTGRRLEQELGVGWASCVHPEDFAACMDCYMEAFVERRAFRMEYRLRRADGAWRWILDHGVPRVSADGTFEGYIGSCIDITDRRESEAQVRNLAEALQERLHERDVLLREVHHRVKNNLQLICSMHSLQARAASGDARIQLEEAQRRIQSIALVHERISAQATFAEIDFVAYVRDATQMVQHATFDPEQVRVAVLGDPVRLSVDQAIPCGLLISELVTNSFKHAFPGHRTGQVEVEMLELPAGKLRVSVRDDGVGLPDSVDLRRPRTTGLDLVLALAQQLGAKLEHMPGTGTRLDVEFQINGGTAHG